jgi:hypothetical protein
MALELTVQCLPFMAATIDGNVKGDRPDVGVGLLKNKRHEVLSGLGEG